MRKSPYTDKFFEKRKGILKSARHIVPLVLEIIEPKSVIDVGCGTGEFLHIFKEHGINNIFGIDGEWLNKKKLLIPEDCFLAANLEKPLKLNIKFDLAISLEVAEHLPKESAKTFIETLTNLSPVVLFSAAIPFQGGTGHVNEQWQEYWAKLFEEKNYCVIDCIRRKIWNNSEVCFWYKQNILLFVENSYLKNEKKLLEKFKEKDNLTLSIVHPELYLSKAKRHFAIKKPIKWIILKLKNFLK